MKGIWPKLDGEVGSREEAADFGSNRPMSPFNRSILARCISASRTDGIASLEEEFLDFRVPVEFTTLVHVNILPRAVRGVVIKEATKPMYRRGFRQASITNKETGEVIQDEDPTDGTVEALEVSLS